MNTCIYEILFQEGASAEVAKREKARLREMQRLKKKKIQEILEAQNAAIDVDMVWVLLVLFSTSMSHFHQYLFLYCN